MPKPTFNEFITEWRRQRLGTLSEAEVSERAETLGRELLGAAMQGGHRAALTKACQPYRDISAYVRALHDINTTRHRKDGP